MPVVLLQQACAYREQAARARRLTGDIDDDDAIKRLLAYAEELEQTARELEARAAALSKTIAKTRTLAAGIAGLLEEARETLQASRRLSRPKKPETE